MYVNVILQYLLHNKKSLSIIFCTCDACLSFVVSHEQKLSSCETFCTWPARARAIVCARAIGRVSEHRA